MIKNICLTTIRYGSYFTMSTMDRYYKPGMNLEEAMDVLKKVLAEVSFIENSSTTLWNFVTDKSFRCNIASS